MDSGSVAQASADSAIAWSPALPEAWESRLANLASLTDSSNSGSGLGNVAVVVSEEAKPASVPLAKCACMKSADPLASSNHFASPVPW